jgi:hypothetical protein
MKWPSDYAEAHFRALFPQYPNACPHAAFDILVDAVRAYRQQAQREQAAPAPTVGSAETLPEWWTRGT